jgi:NitT/TauT family transport system substrate-binding protein
LHTMACQSVLLIAVTILFFAPVSRLSAQVNKLRVGYSSVSAGQSVLWVTKEAGIFQKNGLDVELLFVQSASLMAQALAGQSLPIAIMSGATAIEGDLKGGDFLVLLMLKKTPALTYIVSSKSIAKPEQLKGKKLGISRFGSVSDFLVRMALRELKIDANKDVSLLQIGGTPLRTAALQAGTIDATVLTVEEKFSAEKFGINVLFDLRQLGLEFLTNDVVTTREFLKRDEGTVRRFIKGLVEGIHYYKTRKKESIDIMARYMRSTDRKVIEVGYDFNAEEYGRKPYVSTTAVQLALDEISRRNPKAKETRVDQFFDSRFIKELDATGHIDNLYKQ